ncbi:alpha/beta hydrolase [Actinoplanes sp. NPDC049802]|uniref:alpha/beta fold hydrolase n=1 Tax=Actinoplanes sp. NPDC049802 TaxID=3154742 RepID=UPI0033E4BED4
MAFVDAGPVRLWTERTGDPGDPAVLLIAGACAQGCTTPDAMVDRLVARGVQVIRYDHRDTGLSTVVDFERDPYDLTDLAADALAVLDAYGLPSAHVVGGSMGGMIAQWLGAHAPGRIRSLTLLSTTPLAPGLVSPPTARFRRHLDDTAGDPPGVEKDVALFRVMNGDVRPFDEPATRAMLEHCWARATDPSAAAHHHLMDYEKVVGTPLPAITVPTVIIHGDQDPIFTLDHAEALAEAIPGARLHVVEGMGHVYLSPGLPELLADLIPVPVP